MLISGSKTSQIKTNDIVSEQMFSRGNAADLTKIHITEDDLSSCCSKGHRMCVLTVINPEYEVCHYSGAAW